MRGSFQKKDKQISVKLTFQLSMRQIHIIDTNDVDLTRPWFCGRFRDSSSHPQLIKKEMKLTLFTPSSADGLSFTSQVHKFGSVFIPNHIEINIKVV